METLSITTALEMAAAELELRGYTRSEDECVMTYEKEFGGGYVDYIEVQAVEHYDYHDVWFEISAINGMGAVFCDTEKYPNANAADVHLEAKIAKLINAD